MCTVERAQSRPMVESRKQRPGQVERARSSVGAAEVETEVVCLCPGMGKE